MRNRLPSRPHCPSALPHSSALALSARLLILSFVVRVCAADLPIAGLSVFMYRLMRSCRGRRPAAEEARRECEWRGAAREADRGKSTDEGQDETREGRRGGGRWSEPQRWVSVAIERGVRLSPGTGSLSTPLVAPYSSLCVLWPRRFRSHDHLW